jgi:hypothetical protein
MTGDDLNPLLAAVKTAVAAEAKAFESALAEQTRLETAFSNEEEFVSYFTDGDTSDIVALDVSGEQISVKRSTLMICEGSVLANKFDRTGKEDGADDAGSDSDDEGELIEHCSYCFGKIIDQMRLKRMFPSMDALEAPVVSQHQRSNFEQIVKYYFPGQEKFIMGDGQSFVFQSPGDTNGVLHFLGTKQGTVGWQNPHDSGQVLCSSRHGGTPQHLVGRLRQEAGWCGNAHNKSVTCDLKAVLVKPVGYTLGHTSHNIPSTWKLEGSTDGSSYTVLHQASGDRSITNGKDAYFAVTTGGDAFYRYFQLTCTGLDQVGAKCFHICNFELYGYLKA